MEQQLRASYWPASIMQFFQKAHFAWIWLFIRVWVGFQFLLPGCEKLQAGGWMWWDHGTALEAFFKKATIVPASGKPAIAIDAYRSFLEILLSSHASVWFGSVIALGEIAVGLGLILGAFTGVAAGFGWIMNMNFMLAGSASVNPLLATIGALIFIAFPHAGHLGLDRFLLPLVGTPSQWVKKFKTLRMVEAFIIPFVYIVACTVMGGQAFATVGNFMAHFIPELSPLVGVLFYAGLFFGCVVAVSTFPWPDRGSSVKTYKH